MKTSASRVVADAATVVIGAPATHGASGPLLGAGDAREPAILGPSLSSPDHLLYSRIVNPARRLEGVGRAGLEPATLGLKVQADARHRAASERIILQLPRFVDAVN
jgi:hypothetical protein